MSLRCLCLRNENFGYNVLGDRCLVQTISAEYWPVNRDAAYWMVGAYMAPLLDFGYSPRLAQQKLQGSGVYMRISGPPYKGGGPNPWIFTYFTGLDHLLWADQSLGITGTRCSLMVQCFSVFYYVEHSLVLCYRWWWALLSKASCRLRVELDLDWLFWLWYFREVNIWAYGGFWIVNWQAVSRRCLRHVSRHACCSHSPGLCVVCLLWLGLVFVLLCWAGE